MRPFTNFLLQLQLVLLLIAAATAAQSATCQTHCGDIAIPYPFGIGPPGCYHPGFELICNEATTTSGPKIFLTDGNTEVTKIMLTKGQLQINEKTSFYCDPDIQYSRISTWTTELLGGPYTYSAASNIFLTIGCNVISHLNAWKAMTGFDNRLGEVDNFDSDCGSFCWSSADNSSGNIMCSGITCCQNTIGDIANPDSLAVNIVSFKNETQTTNTESCIQLFLIEKEEFNSGVYSFFDPLRNSTPVVLDWAFGGEGSAFCEAARENMTTFACRSENSYCYNLTFQGGYRCNCSVGFEGNPYISNGCQDINECERNLNLCLDAECINTYGSYSCVCPQGTKRIHVDDPRHCSPSRNKASDHIGIILAIGGGTGLGLLILLVASYLLYRKLQQISTKKRKAMFFRRNHGLLLQKLLTSVDDDVQRTRIFTLEELEKATNNFDATRILGRGGHGTVYKGILADQRIVAIKRSKIVVQLEIEQFINEVAILSQINHRNVVKLFGCCLEAEVPLLVYEFISGGTLAEHLHMIGNHSSPLSFTDRLRIATEVAGALAYLHSSASISIVHRDIKSTNILLDHNNTAKVSDFGASRSIPFDKTQVTTMVQGTFGYLDPEYYHTRKLTEKSDVYSFGVILVEMLTGERVISQTLLEQEKNLVMHFIRSLKENSLFQVLDGRIGEEGTKEELQEIAILAESCLRLKGEERPTMKKVEQKLATFRASKREGNGQNDSQQQNQEKSKSFLNDMLCGSAIDVTRSYSLENEFMVSVNYPR